MLAYTKGISKEEFVAEMRAHQEADRLMKGTYWKEDLNKGCAVGCAIHSIAKIKHLQLNKSEHSNYETHLGIPEWLARVEDTIFEGLPDERSKSWPLEFSEAINSGADLDKIKAPFLVMVLKSTLSTFDHDQYPDVKNCIDGSIALWQRDDLYSDSWHKEAEAAAMAAWPAAKYEYFADELLKLIKECK